MTPQLVPETAPDELRVGAWRLHAGGVGRWERSVKTPEWSGRVSVFRQSAAIPALRWMVTIVMVTWSPRCEWGGTAEAGDPDTALANLLSQVKFPDEFLAAFARPVEEEKDNGL